MFKFAADPTLNEGDGAGGRFAAFEARLLDQMRRNDTVDDLQYWGEQFGVDREEAAQRNWKRQYPLPHRHFRNNVIHQPGSGLRHAPAPARGAYTAPLAREGHQLLVGARRAARAAADDGLDERAVSGA
jgi:hypothetical protein